MFGNCSGGTSDGSRPPSSATRASRPLRCSQDPLLVLTEHGDNAGARFPRSTPGRIRPCDCSGPGPPAPVELPDEPRARAAVLAAIPPSQLVPSGATSYRRWTNHGWTAIEAGGALQAGEWSDLDAARLRALADRAHQLGLWMRVYGLNGYADEGHGWSAGYNFGSIDRVRLRWRAAIRRPRRLRSLGSIRIVRCGTDRAQTMSPLNRRAFLGRALAGTAAFAAPLETLWQRAAVRIGTADPATVRSRRCSTRRRACPCCSCRRASGTRVWPGPETSWRAECACRPRRTARPAFAGPGWSLQLMRNHELSPATAFAPALAYEPNAGGGTTTIVFDSNAETLVSCRASLAGTLPQLCRRAHSMAKLVDLRGVGAGSRRRSARHHPGHMATSSTSRSRVPRPSSLWWRWAVSCTRPIAVDPRSGTDLRDRGRAPRGPLPLHP